MLFVLTRWKHKMMKLSLSTATAETTTFPKHRQTKQFLIILQNNGWHDIQIPWPLKVTSRTWTHIKKQFFFPNQAFRYRVDLIPEQLSPQNTPQLLSSAVQKPTQKCVSLCVSLKHKDVALPYIHVEEIWPRYTRIVKHLMMGTA